LKPPAFGITDAYRFPHAMHRLDLMTSGLCAIAKTRPAAKNLSKSFADRYVRSPNRHACRRLSCLQTTLWLIC
jgi:hypothetical protein